MLLIYRQNRYSSDPEVTQGDVYQTREANDFSSTVELGQSDNKVVPTILRPTLLTSVRNVVVAQVDLLCYFYDQRIQSSARGYVKRCTQVVSMFIPIPIPCVAVFRSSKE